MVERYKRKTYDVKAIKFTGTNESLMEVIDFINNYASVGNIVTGNPLFNEPEIVSVSIHVRTPQEVFWTMYSGEYVYFDNLGFVHVSTKKDFEDKFEKIG